jgi:hypothetical protein
MKETMDQELAEAIRTLEKANSALARIFNVKEGEDEEWDLRANLTHAQQLDQFGWCVCEGTNGDGQMSADCPREGEGK